MARIKIQESCEELQAMLKRIAEVDHKLVAPIPGTALSTAENRLKKLKREGKINDT